MATTGPKVVAGAAAVFIALAHFSGGLRDLEELASPALLRTSINLFDQDSTAFAVAKAALADDREEFGANKIAADATCEFLNSGFDGTQQNQDLVSSINSFV